MAPLERTIARDDINRWNAERIQSGGGDGGGGVGCLIVLLIGAILAINAGIPVFVVLCIWIFLALLE